MIEGLFQPTHLILIAIVALIILGPAKLGDLGGAMGRSVREFKENVDVDHPAPAPTASAPTSLSATNGGTLLSPEDRLARLEHGSAVDGVHATDV